MNDPNISEDIKGSLALLHKLLKQADEEGLIKELTELTKVIKIVISQLDINACNKILENLRTLLEQINNAKFIESIVDVL